MQKIAVCVIAALLDLLELPQMKRLPREFYLREDTIAVAKDLLGKLLVVPDQEGKRVSGMIVELEAYLGVEDKAAHSFGGRRTARNEVTFGIGGHAYVFFIYGMYYQLNFVTGPSDHPHVGLIRAVEPVEGIEVMRERRGSMKAEMSSSGPGSRPARVVAPTRVKASSVTGIAVAPGPLPTTTSTRKSSIAR